MALSSNTFSRKPSEVISSFNVSSQKDEILFKLSKSSFSTMLNLYNALEIPKIPQKNRVMDAIDSFYSQLNFIGITTKSEDAKEDLKRRVNEKFKQKAAVSR